MTTDTLRIGTIWLCLVFTFSDGHASEISCIKEATTCEFYLSVSSWIPMRLGVNKKVYINETDGKIYTYGDESRTPVNPDDVVLADGSEHERALTLFNKTMPGPTITVYKNQEVIVHVTNHMISDGVTVHFHGIEMRGTPWMDGAAFVTQCPILPGQTFTYKFRPNRSGTYIYHSHTGAQRSMGCVGAFIVKEMEKENMKEYVMVLQDYNSQYSSDYMYTSAGLAGVFNPDGTPVFPYTNLDGAYATFFTSSLINGRGRVMGHKGEQLTKTPLSVFTVCKSLEYKFRVIAGGYALQHILSVDGHKMKVVAADGNNIEPIITDFLFFHSGERYDIVIEANESVGNYWIRAGTLLRSIDLTGLAILRYDGAEVTDPVPVPRTCTQRSPCTAVNCPFEILPNWNCIAVDAMKAPDTSDPAPSPHSGNFKEVFVHVGFVLSDSGLLMGHMNGVNLKLPTVSALTQPNDVTGICDSSHNCGPDKVCVCNRPLQVKFGEVVQITFYNTGLINPNHHSIHVHGHSFHILKVGYRKPNSSFTNDIKCPSKQCFSDAYWSDQTWNGGNIPNVDMKRAPRKDTVTLPAGGYVVIRFMADNPGLWFIHCHQEMHTQIGMALMLNVSSSKIPSTPVGFPECRNYPPPTISKPTTDKTEATTKEERTFSREEFWGMFGAMMFVVLLQFLLAMTCRTRNKS